jgi:biopolymer transport protein ExbB
MIESIASRFNEGGFFMWIILGVLAAATAVVFERLVFYFIICRGQGSKVVAQIAEAINSDQPGTARNLIGKGKSPLDRLLHIAIERYENGMALEDIREGVEEGAINELPRMSQRLNYLSLFANVATLLGLLGTIAGLQVSFSSLAAAEAGKKALLLARGISQAMNTTAFGLIVAVPCMIMYTVLANKRDRLVKDIDASVVRLLNFFKKKRS